MITFVKNNKDQSTTIAQLRVDAQDIEEEIFDLRVKQDIMVTPMKKYIEEWLKKSLQ